MNRNRDRHLLFATRGHTPAGLLMPVVVGHDGPVVVFDRDDRMFEAVRERYADRPCYRLLPDDIGQSDSIDVLGGIRPTDDTYIHRLGLIAGTIATGDTMERADKRRLLVVALDDMLTQLAIAGDRDAQPTLSGAERYLRLVLPHEIRERLLATHAALSDVLPALDDEALEWAASFLGDCTQVILDLPDDEYALLVRDASRDLAFARIAVYCEVMSGQVGRVIDAAALAQGALVQVRPHHLTVEGHPAVGKLIVRALGDLPPYERGRMLVVIPRVEDLGDLGCLHQDWLVAGDLYGVRIVAACDGPESLDAAAGTGTFERWEQRADVLRFDMPPRGV